MYKNSKFSRIFVMMIGFVMVSTAFMAIVSEDKKDERISVPLEENDVLEDHGTRAPAQTTRSVLAEIFTGTWCTYCQGGEGALDRLANEYPLTELSILEYHSGDSYEVPGNSDRASWYGVTGYPTCYFDGGNAVVGGSTNPDDPGTYNNYKNKIDSRAPVPSQVTITAFGSLGPSDGTIIANITAIDDIPGGLTNLKARFVVYEDHNETVYVSGREYRLRYTVLETLTEESISLSMYDNLQFMKSFPIDPAWNRDLLGAVVFVQADSTKEILQATSLNLSIGSVKADLAVTPHDISFSNPNPEENEMITIYGKVYNRGTATTPSDVYVRFYDGDPSAGGTQIGSEQNVGLISSGGFATAQVDWSTVGMAGDHEIVVVADYSDTILEIENENNNKAPRFLNIIKGPPPVVEYVQIRDAPNGGGTNLCDPANYPSYPVGYLTTFYAAGYNYTWGFVYDIASTWISSDGTIVDVTAFGASSSVTCSSVNDGTVTITIIDGTWSNINTTQVTVLPPTMDYIEIRDAAGGGGSVVDTRTYSASDTDTFYAAGYNTTAGYLNDVAADWESDDPLVGTVAPATGTSTTFTAQSVGLDSTCTVTATFGTLSSFTGLLTVLGPVIDYLQIRDAPGGGGSEITTATFSVWDSDDFYCAAYNNSVGWTGDVDADWESDAPLVGGVTPAQGTTTTFIAQEVGTDSTCTVTATYNTKSDSTGLLTVLAPKIDEIRIMDAPGGGGMEITIDTFIIWETDIFYAVAFNDTVGFLADVSADWDSDATTVGQVSPATGTSTTFTAQEVSVDSTCTITATYGSFVDTTGLLTVLASTIDEIKIMDSPGGVGMEVSTGTYSVMQTDVFYAAAFNDTTGFLNDVNADWESNKPLVGDVSPTTGSSTTFTAQQVPSDTTCVITATFGLLGDSTDLLIVLAPRVDEIMVRSGSNEEGYEITTETYEVSDTQDFYAAAYNDTVGYLYDVSADWESDIPSVGDVSPSTGITTTFTAHQTASDLTCTITATFGGVSGSTGLLLVLYPRVNYINIRDSAGGVGNPVDTATYCVMDTDSFYAAAYNDTAGYLFEVDADWSSDDTDVGTVTTPGTSTTFTALQTASDLTCTVSASFSGLGDSTGLLTVLSPRVDSIMIRDAADGLGNEVETRTYAITETDVFYAGGYNDTVGYVFDVSADWESDAPTVGDVSPTTGSSTTFTAQEVLEDETCTVTATYGTLIDSTFLLTVVASTIDEIRIVDAPSGAGVEITTATFVVTETDDFYCAAYNDTTGYIRDVSVLWSSDDSGVGEVFETSGLTTTFTAQKVLTESTCTVTALFGFFSDSTGLLTVLPPVVDSIMIRDSQDGKGEVVTTATYEVGASNTFYAAAYNDSVGYIWDVSVSWSCDVPQAGELSQTSGTSTDLTAKEVAADTTCTITATYGTLDHSTGLLTILAPTVDEIKIRSEPEGAGEEITTGTYEAEDTDTFYAAAYNDTVGYLFDVPVQWNSNSETVGAVTPEGSSTTFTAGILLNSGFCTITATYGSISGSTGMLSINAYVDTTAPGTPSKPELITKGEDTAEFSWDPNTEDDLNKYVVQRAEKPNGPWKDVATLDSDETSYTDNNLDSGTTYYYRIIAYDNAGNPSVASESMGIETKEPAGFFQEFLWILIILVIVIVVIIAAAIATRGRKKKAQPPQAAAQPQPQKKALPPPPKKKASPKTKPVEKSEPSKPLPPPPAKEMPPPPPPPEP